MAIERDTDADYGGEGFVPVCDWCGDTLPAEYDFSEAVESKRLNGWHSVKDASGEWWDLCPECYRKHRAQISSIGPSEFGGFT